MKIEKIEKIVNVIKNSINIIIVLGILYIIYTNVISIKSVINDIMIETDDKNLKTTSIKQKGIIGTSGVNYEIVRTKELIDYRIIKEKNLTNKEKGKSLNFQSRISKVIEPKNHTELYYKNLNELLKVKNQTTIVLKSIEEVKWIRDTELFFTLNVKNNSNIPAHNFKYDLLLKDKLEFKKSKSSKIFYEGYTIKENQLSSIPIVTKRDLAKLYNVKYRQILGMGLNVNIPIHFSKMAKEIKGYLKGSKKSGTFSYPFPIEITYETIFGDKVKVITSLYIYIDKN
ncbi:MAG: hypothetical protein HRT40_01775 [Campylobacteraceae bacterium]|nr:hypothetical protein [Campylobacteraceae bacterium]